MVSLSIHKEHLTRLLVVTFKWNVLCCSQKSITNMCTLTRFCKENCSICRDGKKSLPVWYDINCTSIIRSQRHEIPSAKEKEKEEYVIDGLSRLKPFDFCYDRKMGSYPISASSPLKNINIDHIMDTES